MSVFRSLNSKFAVEITLDIHAGIETLATAAGRKETGGILIGHYKQNQSLAMITEFTSSPPDSKKSYTWFTRGTQGLKELLNDNWVKGRYYIGEWHFHPYASPTPSRQDINEMKTIAKSKAYNCPEPILLIIGGSPVHFTWRVFVSLGENNLMELHPLTV